MSLRESSPAWPATQWTLICGCGSLPPEERGESLTRLILLYRTPLEATAAAILTAKGVARTRARAWAEELVEEFLADKWVLGDMLGRLDRRGPARFKTFLYKCLSDAAVDALRRFSRDGKLRAPRAAVAPADDGARRFERNLALHDLSASLRETRRWCEGKGWSDTFQRFCAAFSGEDRKAAPIPERTWRDRCSRIRAHLNEAYRGRVAASCRSEEELNREIESLERLLLDTRGIRWATLVDGALEVVGE